MPKQTDEDKDKTTLMWVEYKKNPTPYMRSVLAEKYAPLVHKIASGFVYKLPTVLDYHDLIQAGTIGLLDAIEKFDPANDKKAQFQTYATFRVRGAILDEINSMDWTPRSVRQQIKSVLKSIEKHYSDNQVEPTLNDIAKESEIEKEDARRVLGQMNKTFMVHVENETMDLIGPTTDHAQTERESMVNLAVAKVLNEDEKSFIILRFFMGYNNKEIQDSIGLKPSELKHIRESALEKLEKEIGDNQD
jgi:RNA polymerase sigma factor for flagellar operon FliA